MSRVVSKVIAIVFGLVLFMGGAELAGRFLFSEMIVYDVEMWRYARQLKAVGLTSGLFFEHQPGASAHLMGVDVQINADGLREREVPKGREGRNVRVAVLGDSITFGWGVRQDQTYARQLEDLLNQSQPLGPEVGFETVNFGVGNYAIGDVANMLHHKALDYQPDVVIYGAFINDAELSTAPVSSPWVLRHSVVAVWAWGRVDRLLRSAGWRDDYLGYYQGLYDEGGLGRSEVREQLALMARACKEKGVPLVVAMLPELHDHGGEPFAEVREFYREVTLAVGAIFIDLEQGLPDNDRRRFWVAEDDAHPDEQANGHFARTLAENVPWGRIVP